MSIGRQGTHLMAMVIAATISRGAWASVASDLTGLTGGRRVQVVWSREVGAVNHPFGDGNYRLMAFDTNTGGERDVLGSTGNYFSAKVTHDGGSILYQNGGNIWIVNWDGSNNRQWLGGAVMGCVAASGHAYVAIGGENNVHRVEIANPNNRQQVYWGGLNAIWLSVSIDEAYLGCHWPWPGNGGLVNTSNGSLNVYSDGCWSSVSPDNQYRFAAFDGAHRNWDVWNFDKGGYRRVVLNNAPGINGWEIYNPRFAENDPGFVTICGPYDQGAMGSNNIPGGGPHVEVYFGKFDGGITYVSNWVQVTYNGEADFYPSALIGAGGAPPPPPPPPVSIDAFYADPGSITAGESSTLSWQISNTTHAYLDGIGDVYASGSFAVQPSQTTTYTLVAEGQNGPVSQQVTVNVAAPPPPFGLPFAMNCGSNSVSGWTDDNAYASGGAEFEFGSAPDTSGVANAAPPAVYQTCRHQEPTFNIPVGSGSYTVRLHFYDTFGGRSMAVVIEGQTVLQNFDIATEAGGTGRALVKEFAVDVSDGDGMQIVFSNGAGEDAFCSGIEVIEGVAPPPPPPPPPPGVSIDNFYANPGSITAGESSTLSWQISNTTHAYLDGIGDVYASGSFDVQPSQTTTYTLVAEGQGGPVQAQATVTVTATPPPPPPFGLPFAMNCGSNSVSGWTDDNAYASGGAEFDFGMAPDTSGVANAAPPAVYQTCRHMEPTFNIPVGSGSYTVRLHFYDTFGGRSMAVVIEGQTVLQNFDIVSEAGAGNALVKEFAVDVSDGDGMQIVFSKGGGDDAFCSGIEVIEGSAPPPPPPPEPSLTLTSPVGGEVWYVGTSHQIRWDAYNQTNVQILYTADDRQTYAIVEDTVSAADADWRDYAWTVPNTPSGQCRILIKDYFQNDPSDESGLFEIRAVADSDGDGMDDGWETDNFGDLTTAGQGTDYDGDGRTDLEEFLAGTDPVAGGGDGLGFGCAPLGSTGAAGAALALGLAFGAARLRRRRNARPVPTVSEA